MTDLHSLLSQAQREAMQRVKEHLDTQVEREAVAGPGVAIPPLEPSQRVLTKDFE